MVKSALKIMEELEQEKAVTAGLLPDFSLLIDVPDKRLVLPEGFDRLSLSVPAPGKTAIGGPGNS